MMKKALSLFLAAAMCAGMLTGCGGGADTCMRLYIPQTDMG